MLYEARNEFLGSGLKTSATLGANCPSSTKLSLSYLPVYVKVRLSDKSVVP